MPLYEGMPAGYGHMAFKNHPMWPDAFKIAETRSWEPHGSRMHLYTIFCEPGTRFILPSYRAQLKYDATLDTIDLQKVIMKDTVVIDIPMKPGEWLAADKLEAAFNKAPVQKGDALLCRTGWGDNERYLKMGHEYREQGPHYSAAAASKLMDLMKKNESEIWLYDNCDMGGTDPATGQFAGFTINEGMIAIGGIVNAGAITKPRVKLSVLPIKAAYCHMAPCRAVAVED